MYVYNKYCIKLSLKLDIAMFFCSFFFLKLDIILQKNVLPIFMYLYKY